jgi:hypothetical protein
MNPRFIQIMLLSLTVAITAIACGGSELTRPEPSPTLRPDPPPLVNTEGAGGTQDASASQPAASQPLTPQEKEAVDIMWRIIDGYGAIDENAVKAAGRNGHPGLVPVLVEVAARTFEPDLALEVSRSLELITGDSVGGDFVLSGPWFSWMSRQDPPQVTLSEYDEWKGQLLGLIDPSFKEFLYSGVPTRIPLWTVEWGGVVRDGIPPLEFPDVRPGNQVDFLNLDEPVFGVTINGESRAYPHRIMGWHELANDRLGGELITFVF